MEDIGRHRMVAVEGARLTRLGNEIWVADRELVVPPGIRLPIRMVVLRDRRCRLLCYSPVALDPQTVEALAGLGQVAWLVVPNPFHQSFLDAARERFPDARVLGCAPPGRRDVESVPVEGSLDDLADFRVVGGSSGFSELALYHDTSETLVVADLVVNVKAADLPLRLWLMANGAWGSPGQLRLQRWRYLRDRRSLEAFYHWAMARPFRQVSVAHGSVVREGAREVIYRLFRP